MSTLPQTLVPEARMTQAQLDQLFVDVRYICEALSMHPPTVYTLMSRHGKTCLRLAGKMAFYRVDADEVIEKMKKERTANVNAGLPNGWK